MNTRIRIRAAETPQGDKMAILPLSGRFDAKDASEIRQMLQQAIDFGFPNLLLDMAAVTFMDSTGLGVLISALRKCRMAGGTLCLCNVPESVMLVFNLTSMEKVLLMFADEPTAVANFPPAPTV